jgi:hypothetical protein
MTFLRKNNLHFIFVSIQPTANSYWLIAKNKMALGFKKPIQSSLSPRYKIMVWAFMQLTGKDSESHAIRTIIEEKFDKLPLPDKLMYKRYIETHYPEEAKGLEEL